MMLKQNPAFYLFAIVLLNLFTGSGLLRAQQGNYENVVINTGETHQTVVGFGASLAYYEGWLNAHPKKSEIYQAIFGELSLDILRVRNAYDYDPEMVSRVSEYMQAAELSLGHPIALLSTSWGPPGYLKNTGDRKNGGTLRFTSGADGVEFDYAGFAHWWRSSLDEYNQSSIYPTYISIQNEPDFSASWESCLLKPSETVNATDTIAGYNQALDAVYDTIMAREHKPVILGPETVGIGYNAVENYVNALDLSKLGGIAHHLYHGVDESNPYASTDFNKVGNFHSEVPHFQSEYSRGDWFSLAGLIYRSFRDEQVVAYLYWDLIWNEGGLVTLEFPWDQGQWTDPQKGYIKTKDFYSFKQFSAFIHPGWQRIGLSTALDEAVSLAFMSPGKDSATCVLVNRSESESKNVRIVIPGHIIDASSVYVTSASENCTNTGELFDSMLVLAPHSITTVEMLISEYSAQSDTVPPVLHVTDTVYVGGFIEATSSEDAVLYLVPVGTVKEQGAIQEAAIDSVAVNTDSVAQISVEGLANGTYWLYARDAAWNISEPEEIIIMGVGLRDYTLDQFRIYPMPVTQAATLQIYLNEGQQLWLTVMDYEGRVVARESIGNFSAGDHQVIFRRNGLTEGLYFIRLESSRGPLGTTKVIIQD